MPCPTCGEVDCDEGFHAPSFEKTVESAGLRLFCTFGPDRFYVSPRLKAFISHKWIRPTLSMIYCKSEDRTAWSREVWHWEDPSIAAVEVPRVLQQVLQ